MTRRWLVLFAAMCVIWGIPYLLIKVAVRDLSPAALVFCRTGIGAVVLLSVAAARGLLRPLLARWKPLLLYTVVELAVPWVLLSTAEKRLSSSLTGLLVAAVPLVGAVVAVGIGERHGLSGRNVVGLLVGIAGVGALVGLDVTGAEMGSVAIVGAVVVGYAVGPIILSRSLHDLPNLGVVAASLALCSLGYAPFALRSLPESGPNGRVIASVVTLGLVCTALAFLVFFELIREIGPVRATVITYVNPAVAVLLGVVFLGESVGVSTALGFALILSGSVLAAGRAERGAEAAGAVCVAEP